MRRKAAKRLLKNRRLGDNLPSIREKPLNKKATVRELGEYSRTVAHTALWQLGWQSEGFVRRIDDGPRGLESVTL